MKREWTSFRRNGLAIANVFLLAVACTSTSKSMVPSSLGEEESSYSYIPLDPLPVDTTPKDACTKLKSVLDSLPDEAVRMAVGSYDATGSVSFGAAKVGLENHTYQVVLDYIDVDEGTLSVQVERRKLSDNTIVSVFDNKIPPKQTSYAVTPQTASVVTYVKGQKWDPSQVPKTDSPQDDGAAPKSQVVHMPVYLGVGLRLTATVRVVKGSVNLSSLAALAAGAEAGSLSGSLVVQTLGVNGKSVSTTLPLPSELNQTTIQNAVMSLGAIKAILYDSNNTQVTPRVVGIYNPIGGGQQFVNGIVSSLSEKPVHWSPPCADTH
jgi:hypothetical protein